jgi:hypothetical protein
MQSGSLSGNQAQSVPAIIHQWQAGASTGVVRSTVRVRTVSEEAMAERLQAGDATRWL